MTDIAALATATLSGDMERLRVISQNLANASTPGYRAQVPAAGGTFEDALNGADASQLRSAREGALRDSGRALDLAISGEGYFAVQTPAGTRYTRRGDFTMDASGRVLTHQGYPLLSEGGPLSVSSPDFSIDPRGVVRVADEIVGQLLLAMPDGGAALRYADDGLYAAADELSLAPPSSGKASIRQGALEMANVNPLDQMVAMMETVRHFSTSAHALKAYDQMLDAAINQSADFQG